MTGNGVALLTWSSSMNYGLFSNQALARTCLEEDFICEVYIQSGLGNVRVAVLYCTVLCVCVELKRNAEKKVIDVVRNKNNIDT